MTVIHILMFFHVTFVVLALGIMVFPGILLRQIALTGDAAAIRTAYRVGSYHGRVGGMLLLIGVLFGFALAGVAHYPFGVGWLIAVYIAVVALVALGIAAHQRHEAAILAAASSGRADAGDECVRLANDPRQLMLTSLSGLIWLFALFDMIVKPF